MKRWAGIRRGLMLLALAGVLVYLVLQRPAHSAVVYTPTQLLALHRRLWPWPYRGQTVWVRGYLQHPTSWPGMQVPIAVLLSTARADTSLVVYVGAPTSVVDRLYALPWLRSVLPPTAAHPLLRTLATFQLRVIACRTVQPRCAPQVIVFQLADGGSR